MENIPAHVAIILDGNGRWAKKRGLPRTAGHAAGAKNVETITIAASNLGIRYLTLYAFSTENWKRSVEEVSTIMSLLAKYLLRCRDLAMENNIRVTFIGDLSGLDEKLHETCDSVREETAGNTGMTLTIALNYGGRDEIVRALNRLLASGERGPVTEEGFASYLDTAGQPYPDLMIRTSGEERISNFLPWQLCYSEFYFTDTAWPDFSPEELEKACEAYASRDRRFGGVK